MKKALLLAIAFVAILIISNPDLSAHRAAVLKKGTEGLNTDAGRQITRALGAEQVRNQLSSDINQRISRDNFGLFSLTKSSPALVVDHATGRPATNIVGIGILGNIYLWGEDSETPEPLAPTGTAEREAQQMEYYSDSLADSQRP